MKIMKTRYCKEIDNDYFVDSLLIYIERQIATTYSVHEIINDFKVLKKRRLYIDSKFKL